MPPFFLKFLLVWTLLRLWALLKTPMEEALGLREEMWPYASTSYSLPTNFLGGRGSSVKGGEEGKLGFIPGNGIVWTRPCL